MPVTAKKINLPMSWLFLINGNETILVDSDEKEKFTQWRSENSDLIFKDHGAQFYGWSPLLCKDVWQYPCVFM